MSWDSDLRTLLEQSTAYFQPIVDLSSGHVLGAEALVRFANPDGTVRGPLGIIERVEEDLDLLELLTRRLFCLIREEAGPILHRHPGLYIGLNIPPLILGSPRLKLAFDESGLLPFIDRMVCEVTERQALTDAGREALTIARTLGVRIAMDDFGTGQSGLKQLIGLPLDILKIDKSEVDPLMRDPTADRLLRGVVALAAALRVKVVAEGVETREQAFFLRAAGVDAGQGWLWSRAVPADRLERLIATGVSAETWALPSTRQPPSRVGDVERPRVVTPDVLTPVELRVAKLLCMEHPVADIANQIGESPEHVERLCDQMFRKVGAKDRAALIRWAKVYDIVRW